jgi:hypothetical protein
MRRAWLVAFCLSLGCASARPPQVSVDPGRLDLADAKVLQGCYDCLLEAHDAYAAAAAGRARPLVIQRLFETDLLIALREREFALADSGAAGRARALLPELAPALEGGRYLRLLEAIPAEHGSWSRAEVREFRAARMEAANAMTSELVWLDSAGLADPVRRYLAMTIACVYPAGRGPRMAPRPQITRPAAAAPPLVRYRMAACVGDDSAALAAVRADVPAFPEVAYLLGVNAVSAIAKGGGPDPRPLIAEAAARFPDAVAVTFLSAALQRSIGNCEAALPLYATVIGARPEHEDAWLGRTICLTDLGRRREAIDAATHLVDRRFDNAREAQYWRAFNHHQLGELDLARQDIEAVRKSQVTLQALQLAGIIEHDQDDLDQAEADLTFVVRQSSGYCTAQWYLAMVFVKRKDWPKAADGFDTARLCYATDVEGRQVVLAQVEGNDTLDAEYKRAQIAKLGSEIASSRQQQHAAALNAAKFFAATGNLDAARLRLDAAENDPALKDDLEEFRTWLAGASPRSGPP